MNIRFNSRIHIIILLVAACLVAATRDVAAQLPYPVIPADDMHNGQSYYNRTNCTFGEIHGTGGDHIHGAIDIDTWGLPPVRAVAPGNVLNNADPLNDPLGHIGIGVSSVTLVHDLVNGVYIRRSRYLHINPNPNLSLDQGVNYDPQIQLGTVRADDGHVHLELWHYDIGTDAWYRLNPLRNGIGWQLRSPTDRADPQVNDVFLEVRNNEPAGVVSGYDIPEPQSGATNDVPAAPIPAARIHFQNRPGSQDTIYNADNDRLIVYGSVGPIVYTRDEDINGGENNNALTIHSLHYSLQAGGNVYEKFNVLFDRIQIQPTNEYQEHEEIFHLTYNNNVFNNDYRSGNNDYIELRDTNSTYLYPHKTINGIQSNGIWFTKARVGTPDVFDQTPVDIAGCNTWDDEQEEAKYPDSEYTLRFYVEDAAGRVDRAPSGRDVNAKLTVIVDNFRPYVKQVQIESGNNEIYFGEWIWDPSARTLTLEEVPADVTERKADSVQPLMITVTTSEPMRLTDAERVQISIKTEGAADPWFAWTDPQSVSHDRMRWTFFVPVSAIPEDIAEDTPQSIYIRGKDLAGNGFVEYDGTFTSFAEALIPRRTGNAPPDDWTPDYSSPSPHPGVDEVHRFQFGTNETLSAATYGGTDHDTLRMIQPTTDGGYIMAGKTSSFGVNADIWILKLDSSGEVIWQKTYGGTGIEEIAGIHQTGDGGYMVGGRVTSPEIGGPGAWMFKLDSTGNVVWQKSYNEGGISRISSFQQTSDDGYIIAGATGLGFGLENIWIAKLNNSGNIIWQKVYGDDWLDLIEEPAFIHQTGDGNYIVVGYSDYPEGMEEGCILVFNLDGQGNILWQKGYGATPWGDGGHIIHQTSDGGYLVGGEQGVILKLDSSGNITWQKAYGSTMFDVIQPTNDGHYLVGGDNVLFKLDSAGNVIWQKRYTGINSVHQTDDGYVVGTSSWKAAMLWDFLAFTIDEEGNSPFCAFEGPSTLQVNDTSFEIVDLNLAVGDTDVTITDTNVSPGETSITPEDFCQLPVLTVKQGLTTITYGGTYNFEPTQAGLSTTIPFTIENLGTGPLDLGTSAVISVGSPEFSVAELYAPPVTLQPGESVSFEITFTPDPQTTTEQTASVYITSTDPTTPYVFEIRGNQVYELTVKSTEGGFVLGGTQCGETFTENHVEGTTVNLRAIPNPAEDVLFAGWTVEEVAMGLDDLLLRMTEATEVQAAFTRKQYLITGRVQGLFGTGIAGVIMDGLPGTPTTDSHGFYSAMVDSGWLDTVTPWAPGYVLQVPGSTDSSRSYPLVREDYLNQDYEAAPAVMIEGQILMVGGTGISDVLLDGFSEPVFTAKDGTYTASVPSGWSGTVTPEKTGYTFAPSTFVHTNVTADLSGQDAVGTSTDTYTMSGSVQTSGGQGIPGVTLTGLPDTTVTSSEGAYSAEVNSGWSGTVTPQKDGYTFTPSTVPYSAVTGPLTQDYTGTRSYSLTVNPEGTGTGTVTSAPAGIACGTDCVETYAENTPITLSAVPDTGSTFTGWSGGGCSGTGTCLVTLTEDTTVSAVFTEDIPQHTMTVVTDGEGTGIVASSPDGILCGEDCTEPFDDGTPVILDAMPQSDSTFTGWSGGGCSGTDPCEVTMTADTIVTATFSPIHTLIVEKAGSGTGTVIADGIDCGTICENSYDAGTGLVLKAIPDAGYTFTGWQVNGVSSGCLVVIDGPTTVTATFE